MERKSIFFHIFNGLPRNTSFRGRLFLSFLTIAIPALAAMAIVSYLLTADSIRQTLTQAQETQLMHLNSRLTTVYSNIEGVSRDILLSSDIQSYLTKAAKDNSYPEDSAVSYTVSALMSGRDYIDSIVITGKNYTLFSTSSAYTDKASFQNIQEKWWYPYMISQNHTFAWYPYATLTAHSWRAQQFGEIPPQINTHMLARPIYEVNAPSNMLGYLMIYVSQDYMHNLWHDLNWGNTTNIFLLDKNNHVLDSNNSLRDYSEVMEQFGTRDGNELVRFNGAHYIYSCTDLGINDWKTVMITPYRELNRPMPTIAIVLIILIIALTFLIFIMSNRSSVNMSRPIIVLSQVMDAYHGSDTEAPPHLVSVYEQRTDEIGGIYRSYAQLQNRINSLIQEIYVKNLEKKDAELALLQSQINPHFLYNTLDSINWLALMHEEEEISNMVTALSDTFRLSLMKNNSYFVQLALEIEYIESYLMLQKFRYGDKLTYTIDVPEESKALFLPRFILQPLVENSLKHGIRALPNGGRISITVEVKQQLTIEVENDGNGIDLEKMSRILVYDPAESELLSFKSEGYGVQNIFRRIKVICGNEYGLAYSMRRGKTVCTVTLPIRKTDSTVSP